jgi:hypothetical protein
MKKNMGAADKLIRVMVAIGVFVAIGTGALEGTLAWVLGAAGVVFVVTSLVSFCPLYAIVGIKTCKTDA